MTEEDTRIKVKVKSWPEMIASAEYIDKDGLHLGGWVYEKEFLGILINAKEIEIEMHMYGIWCIVDIYPYKIPLHKALNRDIGSGAPVLVLLQILLTEEEEARAEKHLKDVIDKYNSKRK